MGRPDLGTSFGIVLPGGVNAGGLMLPYELYWVHQDPNWDWHQQLTLENFTAELKLSDQKFEATASTDDPDLNKVAYRHFLRPDLDKVRKRNGKIIHYHGIADPLIIPFGSYNYVSRVFDRYGVEDAQSFMRSFFYPGNGHCGGGAAPLINGTDLFNALVNWVENGVAPDYIVARIWAAASPALERSAITQTKLSTRAQAALMTRAASSALCTGPSPPTSPPTATLAPKSSARRLRYRRCLLRAAHGHRWTMARPIATATPSSSSRCR